MKRNEDVEFVPAPAALVLAKTIWSHEQVLNDKANFKLKEISLKQSIYVNLESVI